MYSIRLPNGDVLDTPLDFTIQFELANQVFLGSSTGDLPGSFSVPVDVPLTPQMRVRLGHPYLVTNGKASYEIEGVWVLLQGVELFFGTLKIISTTRTRCKISVISKPFEKLKSTTLGQLDLGSPRSMVPYSFFHVFMRATARNPENFDFAFFPVENPNCNSFPDVAGDPAPVADQCFQNYYTMYTSQEFSEASGACTPFVRLDYLLSRLFLAENTGFSFHNGWQTSEELRRLYVYNNYDCRVLNSSGNPILPLSFRLNPHLPNIKCTEFLKKVMAQNGLGLFTNLFSHRIQLLELEDVLNRPVALDWTDYAIGDYEIEPPLDAANLFNYAQAGDTLPADFPAPYHLDTFATLGEYGAFPVAEGFYYIESTGQFVKVEANKDNRFRAFQGEKVGDNGVAYEAGMDCLPSHERYYKSPVEVSRFRKIEEDGNIRYERQVVDPPVALMLYRGIQTVGGDGIENVGDIPYASNHVWVPDVGSPATRNRITATGATPVDSERSLNWFGEYGLYNVAHRRWQEMLRNSKPIRQTFALPIAQLTAFGFENKIRIQNMDYLARSLRVGKGLGKGLVLVEARLLSIV